MHTPQSLTIDPSTPGFNAYFPMLITPDPQAKNSDWWTIDVSGNPKSNCSSQLTTDSEVYKAVASGAFEKNMIALNELWTAERTLYWDLKNNPQTIAGRNDFQEFLNKKSNSSLSKLYEVWAAIENTKTLNASDIYKIDDYRAKIQVKIQLIEEKDIALEVEQTPLLQAARNELLEQVRELYEVIRSIQLKQYNSMLSQLAFIQEQNNAIVTSNLVEANEKNYNRFYLQHLAGKSFTIDDIAQIKALATQCPKTGGMAVVAARNLLPTCAIENINDYNNICYPAYQPPVVPTPFAGSRQEATSDKHIESQCRIIPNPAQDYMMITSNNNSTGKVQLIDMLGKVTLDQSFQSGALISLDGLSASIYIANIMIGTKVETHKIIIKP